MSELVIYSGRNRPDLGPIYELYRQLTGTTVRERSRTVSSSNRMRLNRARALRT